MDKDKPKDILQIKRKVPLTAEDPYAARRKKDREDGRQAAQMFADEALLLTVQMMRNPGVDDKVRFQCQREVMNRAWGTPKATADEDPRMAAHDMLEILAAFSLDAAAEETARRLLEATQPQQAVHPAQRLDELDYIEVTDDGQPDLPGRQSETD